MCTPVSTISAWCSASACASRTSSGIGRDRFAPRASVVAQKVQCSSQPSWILSQPRDLTPASVPRGLEHLHRIGPPDDRTHARQRGDGAAAVTRGGAAHHDARTPGAAEAPDEVAQLGFALAGHRTGVDDGEIGIRGVHDDDDALVGERLAHQLGVVLVRLTAEGVKVDVHGRTVMPSRKLHTRSVSPTARRCRCSSPMSISPRPPASRRPVPTEAPHSRGAAPAGLKGMRPPRAPSRSGTWFPSSAPTAQFVVLCAYCPASPQLWYTTVAATRVALPGCHPTAPPTVTGRSLRAISAPASRARNRESDRANAATRRVGPSRPMALAEIPAPS